MKLQNYIFLNNKIICKYYLFMNRLTAIFRDRMVDYKICIMIMKST